LCYKWVNESLRELFRLNMTAIRLLMLATGLLSIDQAQARLEVCNQTDLVLMVAVGYDTTPGRTVSEGWWKLYPGFCEVPADVAFIDGSYFVHAESDPRSTMPVDRFSWGEERSLCAELSDFRLPNSAQCSDKHVSLKYNRVSKNWRNVNKANITHPSRAYENQFRVRVAGVQRLLSVLGYDVGKIDGVIGEKTVIALNEVGVSNRIFGLNFDEIFPTLEKLIAKQQRLDN